ncbi:hypothetical protein B0T26DRAFT_747018 [Lasiosphaeria miniovina]|uniref:NACHT domain-containing protein n=1 Tax=Lasiosphaeria miniovina TaxID=1954250 RepID=A0AA40BJ82_9PEZI|nr:uncharacterized protein B0T26DRAFT_747018 [Lasiosphaeria miniovina]KAK0735205.1 hypothetical protein B0T26DRAFT_747018 [Lasiosphaeria miniovina]
MDPITSFSLASGAAQLADFTFKLISGTTAIYKSAEGASDENASIEAIAARLQALAGNVADASELVEAGLVDKTVANIAKSCGSMAKQLLHALDQLKTDEKTVWKSFWAALKTLWQKTRIQDMVATLSREQASLVVHLQWGIANKQSSMHEALRQIDERTLQLRIDRTETLQHIRDAIKLEIAKAKEDISQEIAKIKDVQTTESGQPILLHEDTKVVRLVNVVASLVVTAQQRNDQHAFLSTLYFDTIMARQAGIREAHPQTFDWAFRDNMPDGTPLSLNSWLRSGSGIFWIRGKAGSGKSTLTKFVIQSPFTRTILKAWAGRDELVIANHFFWNSGSKLQMSQTGLFRTLLFEMLRHCPEVIPQICEAMPHVTEDSYQWTTEDLLLVMEVVSSQKIPKKFCFFIDGLDEYEGDHYHLIDMLRRLVSFGKAKICCSSRPWTCFIDAFGESQDRLLKLEDLTKNDIRRYVQDNFDKHPQFLKHHYDPEYKTLVDDVVGRAHGVFLWVFLVVRSLRDGLTYADRVSDLQKRLDTLPPDLETFFQHILDSVDPFYRQQSSEVFLLAAYAPESLPLPIYHILDNIDDSPSKLLSMSLTARDLGLPGPWKDKMARRLDARTKGLIEVIRSHNNGDPVPPQFRHVQMRAEFLHRTVRDFLLTGDVNTMLRGRCRADFSPATRLNQAFLVLLRSSEIIRAPSIANYVESFAYFAWRIEQEQNTAPPMALMKAAEAALAKLDWMRPADPHKHNLRPASLFALALSRGIYLYATALLNLEPDERLKAEISKNESPLLSLVILPFNAAPYHWWSISVEFVQLLLEQGASPSARPARNESTPFEMFLGELKKRPLRAVWKDELGLEYAGAKAVLGAMIAKGAPLNRLPEAKEIIRSRFDMLDAEYLLSLSPMAPAMPAALALRAKEMAKRKSATVGAGQEQAPSPSSPGRLSAKPEKADASPKRADHNKTAGLTARWRGLLSKKDQSVGTTP